MTDGASDEVEWVTRAKAGSDAAFAQLVDAHGQAVRSFVRRLVPSPDEADDVAQEAFLTAWMRLSRLKDPSKFRTWLLGIAWRKAKTRARTFARARARDTAWGEARAQVETGTPETKLALDQAMAQLEEAPRACIALNLGAGLSHGEIVQVLDLPLGTVKSHIARGRGKLMSLLKLDETGEGESE